VVHDLGATNRYLPRITPQFSGRALPYVTWHSIHHGPLQLLLAAADAVSLAPSLLWGLLLQLDAMAYECGSGQPERR
jgi:hypothetical protein